MKLIKFNKDCSYQIIYYKNNDFIPNKLDQLFKKDQTLYIDMVLEKHKSTIDVTYDQGVIVLFGLKNEDYEVLK